MMAKGELKTGVRLWARQEWLDDLDAVVRASGFESRPAYIEQLVIQDAARRGLEMRVRLIPSKFNPWIDPEERSAAW